MSCINKKDDSSLLKKYNIPVEHLSFEYVRSCQSKKELERIVTILRSGEEGFYADLLKTAEDQLRHTCSNSRLLRVEEPVLKKSALDKEEREQLESEMLNWENDMTVMDKSLTSGVNSLDIKGLPEIRKVTPQADDTENKKLVINKKNEKIKCLDYNKWDKFDVDEELIKIDVEEEAKQEQLNKQKREAQRNCELEKQKQAKAVPTNIAAGDYLTPEKLHFANQAKDRGNECFKTSDYTNALKYYNISIGFHPTAVAFNNKAMTYLKLKDYPAAVDCCSEVLKIEPNNVKALHRRGTAYQSMMGRNAGQLALSDFEKVLTFEPNNTSAQKAVTELRRKLNIDCNKRRRMFVHSLSDEQISKLPLTYYGPSTSGFECLPYSVQHRILLQGSSLYGPVVCKCNNHMARTNPLCQRCGEKMSRPPPLKKRIIKLEKPIINEKVKENDDRNQKLKAEEINKKNTLQNNLDEFINSKFETKQTKNVYNTNVGTSKGVYIEEIVEEKQIDKLVENITKGDVTNIEESHSDKLNSNEQNIIKTVTDDIKTETPKNDCIWDDSGEEKGDKSKNDLNKSFNNLSIFKQGELESDHKTETPSTSKHKNRRKKNKKNNSSTILRMANLSEPKIVQASKYIKPTSKPCRTDVEDEEITTAYQFIKLWEASMKSDKEFVQRERILRSVKPNKLEQVVGNKLDGPMLSSILSCLDLRFASTPDVCVEYMNELAKLPRFGIIIMFLESTDKTVVRSLFDRAEQKGIVVAADLKQRFFCT